MQCSNFQLLLIAHSNNLESDRYVPKAKDHEFVAWLMIKENAGNVGSFVDFFNSLQLADSIMYVIAFIYVVLMLYWYSLLD